jgi:phosphocarrier protein HPr
LITREIPIINRLGLHARAAAKLVHMAARFKSDIKIRKGSEEVDAKSILGILLLAAAQGSNVTLTAAGEDETVAMQEVESLFAKKFDEVE